MSEKKTKVATPAYISPDEDAIWRPDHDKMEFVAGGVASLDIVELQAERDRYKKALEDILEHHEAMGVSRYMGIAPTTVAIAKQALKGGGDE